ncbi:MAG: MauE/DoxX family redox-associated membrane protein [Gammaproteobacteria bacterium]|jgi:hypothetical protein
MPCVVHYALVLFFLWLLAGAAAHKLLHPGYYSGLVRSHVSSGETAAAVLVRLIAAGEAALAVSLIVPPARTAAFLATALLLAAYALAILRQLAAGKKDMRCGCAGPASDLRISPALVARNCLLVALALVGGVPATGGMTAVQAVIAGIMGLFLITVYLCSEQLLHNAQQLRALRS